MQAGVWDGIEDHGPQHAKKDSHFVACLQHEWEHHALFCIRAHQADANEHCHLAQDIDA